MAKEGKEKDYEEELLEAQKTVLQFLAGEIARKAQTQVLLEEGRVIDPEKEYITIARKDDLESPGGTVEEVNVYAAGYFGNGSSVKLDLGSVLLSYGLINDPRYQFADNMAWSIYDRRRYGNESGEKSPGHKNWELNFDLMDEAYLKENASFLAQDLIGELESTLAQPRLEIKSESYL